jgi:hypothetical protein
MPLAQGRPGAGRRSGARLAQETLEQAAPIYLEATEGLGFGIVTTFGPA